MSIDETWAHCRILLGISDEEFWARTPHETNLLMSAHITRCEIDDGRTGIIASLLANIYRDKKKRKKEYSPVDFMPDRRGTAKRKSKVQTPAEMLHHLKALTTAMGGHVHPRHGKMSREEALRVLEKNG